MRKISFLLILCFSTLLLSCKDELELRPFDKVDEENAFKTQSDFTAALRGAYQRMLGGVDGDYYPRKMLLSDVLSDNLIISQSGRRSYQNYYQFQLDANSTWGLLLSYGYSTIDRANRIIANIDNLPDGDFKNSILGQAKAVRALAHFDIAMTFAPSFKVAQPDAVNTGIPIKQEVDAAAKPFRNTLNETFNFIIEELKAAKDLTPDDRGLVASGFMGKTAISALLARVYLYKGDNINAELEAKAATTLIGSADLAIASRDEFPNIWKDNSAGNAGVLFKLLVTEQDRVYPGTEYNQVSPNGVRSEYLITYDFFQLYKDEDVRKNSYLQTSEFTGFLYNHIIKYVGRPASSAGVVDVKVIRGAEVYLILAEAAYENNNYDVALEALDAVRSRRYLDFVSPNESGQALLDAILLERRLELAFEGHRFYDLKRLGLPIVRSDVYGDIADGTGLPAPASTRLIQGNDFRFTLPIPTGERQANPNFEQSPNY